MRKFLKTKKDKAILISLISVIFLGIALISNIIGTRTALKKIISDAKAEAERTLLSTGIAMYAEDVGESNTRPLSNENLPENTAENPQNIGTIVASKENWNIETVTAVSVGNGETIPVPKGFYYVGGDLNTGVIISDDKADEYDRTTDKTTWEYTTNLKGNQFVWIPCTEEEYVKSEVWNGTTQKTTGTTNATGTLCLGGWDKTTYTSELPQIRKYGGFYVARYEAGLAETIPEFTETHGQDDSNQVYNSEGIPQSRAGQVPWMFINWNHSQANAKNMYNTNSVSSGLITGTQWDIMLKKMAERTLTEEDLTNSVKWGNYKNNSIEYRGRMAKAYFLNGYRLEEFGEEIEGKTTIYTSRETEVLTTGASRQTEKYHIFDVAGNLWEWTDEASLYKEGSKNETNVQFRIVRGGSCADSYVDCPACYRDGTCSESYIGFEVGFRVVLYIK